MNVAAPVPAEDLRDRARLWRLSLALVALTFVLIALGGVPHATAPLDQRAWLPGDPARDSISALHRVTAALTGVVAIALAGFAALRLRTDRRVLSGAVSIVALLTVQGLSLATASRENWRVWAVGAHFGASALLFAVAIWLALLPRAEQSAHMWPAPSTRYLALLRSSVAAVFLVLLSGAALTTGAMTPTCAGWPLCGNGLTSLGPTSWNTQLLHRALVFGAGLLITALFVETWHSRRHVTAAMAPALAVVAIFAVESVAGAFTAWTNASESRAALHFVVATLVWGLLIGALVTQSASATARVADAARPFRAVARDYLRVTKPGIIVLLLITTLGAMLLAGPGWPAPWLVLTTLFGGTLASGGASALNCYLDRDIDGRMARTRKRPIPTGGLSPAQVRRFGIVLSALAVLELALLVNPLAALLALAGNLFYVGIYTRWLKRATPQNIVIGGAAGAFPPLVGWAAVTGSLEPAAFVLFAIIFYWTPPHFWALALLKANDYRRAGIPMLPVTHGEQHTRRMILLYALLLVAVTLLMTLTGIVGWLYAVAALALGGAFITLAARMYVAGDNRLAWRLFKFSNYYLTALLAAMVLDRALGW